MTPSEGEPPFKYRVVLTIKHPNLDARRISRTLGIKPTNHWTAGEGRVTPAGTRLPGTNAASLWTASKEVAGDRFFFGGVLDLVTRLESAAHFISEIVESGGTISIIIQLPGTRNIGDEINWPQLARLVALKVTLGIELFLEFD